MSSAKPQITLLEALNRNPIFRVALCQIPEFKNRYLHLISPLKFDKKNYSTYLKLAHIFVSINIEKQDLPFFKRFEGVQDDVIASPTALALILARPELLPTAKMHNCTREIIHAKAKELCYVN